MREATTRLRAVEEADLEKSRHCRNDERVWVTALGRPFPITADDERKWYESLSSAAFPATLVWSVVDSGDKFVGMVRLDDVNWIHRTASFGIWIAPERMRMGHAKAATRLALRHGFHHLGLRQVRLHVLASHNAARKLYAECGFRDEAVLTRAVLVNGEERDVIIMLCRADDISN